MRKIVRNKFTKFYEEESTGRNYRQVIAAMGWPYLDRPGFIVVMAEDAENDFSLVGSPRHFRIIDEFESYEFEPLYRAAAKFAHEYGIVQVYCDWEDPARLMWDKIPDAGETPVSVSQAPFWDKTDLRFIAQVVFKRTTLQKSLHFGHKSRLPGYVDEISALPLEDLRLNQYPALTAIGIALAKLELGTFSTGGAGFRPDRSLHSSSRYDRNSGAGFRPKR